MKLGNTGAPESSERRAKTPLNKPSRLAGSVGLELIVEQAIKRKIVPQLGRETVRVLLESHELKPWREKNVVSAADRHRLPDAHGRRAGTVRTAS
jgi:hypothetical protein